MLSILAILNLLHIPFPKNRTGQAWAKSQDLISRYSCLVAAKWKRLSGKWQYVAHSLTCSVQIRSQILWNINQMLLQHMPMLLLQFTHGEIESTVQINDENSCGKTVLVLENIKSKLKLLMQIILSPSDPFSKAGHAYCTHILDLFFACLAHAWIGDPIWM